MSSRFLLPGEADSNPICNMWARDTRATGCSVVTGSPVDAPRVYQRGYAAENRVHWLYEVPISIDQECGAVRFWEDIMQHNGSVTAIAGQGVPRNDAPGRIMLSFATSPQTPAIRAGWTTKLHLAPGTRRRIPPAAPGDCGAGEHWPPPGNPWARGDGRPRRPNRRRNHFPPPTPRSVIARRQRRGPLARRFAVHSSTGVYIWARILMWRLHRPGS